MLSNLTLEQRVRRTLSRHDRLDRTEDWKGMVINSALGWVDRQRILLLHS